MLFLIAAAAFAANNSVKAPTLEGCLAKPSCVGVIVKAFDLNFTTYKTEVEGSEPGRFFEKTVAFALDVPEDGHFLEVNCLTSRTKQKPCPQYRDELEARLFNAALLQSLPTPDEKVSLFDPQSWVTKAKGQELVGKVKKNKALWAQLGEIVHRQ